MIRPALTRQENLRVLIVDDNKDAADSLGLMIGLLGAEPQVAYGARAALGEAERFRPNVVLLDIGAADHPSDMYDSDSTTCFKRQ
jgi:CheY-like chemotaxis protein